MQEQETNITTLESDDGTVYLRTQHGRSAEEIAESLKPYIGRTMSMELPNLYGHYRRYRGILRAVNGAVAKVYVPGQNFETEINAFDAFGSHCTMIDKEN